MPTARNIHGNASPELHGQARSLATGHDTTIPSKARPLLPVQPGAANQPRNPASRPQFAATRPRHQQAPKMSAYTPTNPPRKPQYEVPKAVCIPVKRT